MAPQGLAMASGSNCVPAQLRVCPIWWLVTQGQQTAASPSSVIWLPASWQLLLDCKQRRWFWQKLPTSYIKQTSPNMGYWMVMSASQVAGAGGHLSGWRGEQQTTLYSWTELRTTKSMMERERKTSAMQTQRAMVFLKVVSLSSALTKRRLTKRLRLRFLVELVPLISSCMMVMIYYNPSISILPA